MSSFVCTVPPSRLPQSALPWPGSGSQFLTHLLCLSLRPLPSATLAFMVLAWGAHASPSVQSHMLSARTAKLRPVLGDSTPAPVAGLRPFLPNVVARKQPGCHVRPGLHMVVVRQDRVCWPRGHLRSTRPACQGDGPWSGSRSSEACRRAGPSQAAESHPL